jgi:hypothetical protein
MRTLASFFLLLIINAATAQDTIPPPPGDVLPPPAEAPVDLEAKPSGAWIAIDGTISTVGGRSFILAYDGGTVPVAYGGEALREHQFQQGEKVTVFGWVDKDLFERKVLKASSVVVGADGGSRTIVGDDIGDASRRPAGAGFMVHGRVTGIDGRMITVEQAEGHVLIDTRGMSYDPTRAEGHRRVDVGDIVTAQGSIDNGFWGARTFKARSLDVVKMGMREGERILDQAPVEGDR